MSHVCEKLYVRLLVMRIENNMATLPWIILQFQKLWWRHMPHMQEVWSSHHKSDTSYTVAIGSPSLQRLCNTDVGTAKLKYNERLGFDHPLFSWID